MLRKLRPRLSFANVTSLLALFFALGGSAYAAFVVSSNSQIGPDTIYGASKPASANDNVVAGSIGGTDLAPGSVGTGKVIDNSLGAIDLAANSVDTSELKDGSVTNAKLAPDSVDTSKVKDLSLNDEDIGRPAINFQVGIGEVIQQGCEYRTISGIDAQGDHLLLTPNYETSSPYLSYGIEYQTGATSAKLKICNPTTAVIDDGYTNFNLLVIDAQ